MENEVKTINSLNISKLKRNILIKFSMLILIMGLMLFLTAGTLNYWEAWVFIAILAVLMFSVVFYFIKRDPELLQRRIRMKEKVKEQKVIIYISYVYLLAFFIPGFDKRFGWSSVPEYVVVFSDIMIIIGYMIFISVLKVNSYASRIIEVEDKQKVITTGPYSYVRHPMYVGVLLIYFFAPLSLSSYWALFSIIIIIVIIIPRILNEEKVLSNELEGYKEYMMKTKYRLIPGIW